MPKIFFSENKNYFKSAPNIHAFCTTFTHIGSYFNGFRRQQHHLHLAVNCQQRAVMDLQCVFLSYLFLNTANIDGTFEFDFLCHWLLTWEKKEYEPFSLVYFHDLRYMKAEGLFNGKLFPSIFCLAWISFLFSIFRSQDKKPLGLFVL